ncbi:MAG: ATP-dependent helicase HrpB [Venatoribacter sp.]
MLPIHHQLDALKQALNSHSRVLLCAAPGAGKTTVVPLALLHEPWLANKKILMLEPRRMAARNAALYMAESLQQDVGQQVGYRIRLENKVSQATRIEVVTEGVLTRLIQADPELSAYGLVIFDEFHERHLHSDLGLALCLSSQELLRDDLKLLIMSATLDGERLSEQLSAPLISSEGRSFPLTTLYRPFNSLNQNLIAHCQKIINEALSYPGDILVFLPGVKEINQLQDQLADNPAFVVFPLHGQLNDEQQKAALAANAKRKIILATNIAESSLTIDGVRIVIDSGLERRVEFHLASGLNELKTRFISQSSSVQRAGRAARQASGLCLRLWNESQQQRLDSEIQPEIQRLDLAPLLLELLQWGADIHDLFWLNKPSLAAINQARELLVNLGICNQQGTVLTEHGKHCARLGIEPRYAHALIHLQTLGYAQEAALIIAKLQESQRSRHHCDDFSRLNQTNKAVQVLAKNLVSKLVERHQVNPNSLQENEVEAFTLALIFPDRIAKKRSNKDEFLLANGRAAKILPDSSFHHASWLVALELSTQQDSIIRLAIELSPHLLQTLEQFSPELFSKHTEIGFQENGQYSAQIHHQLGKIIISSEKLPKLNEQQWQQAWLGYLQAQGLTALSWQDHALQLRARLKLAHAQLGEPWPDVSDEALITGLNNWLLPFLGAARHLRDLAKVDLYAALLSLLDWPQQQQLNQLLPTHITVPSGSNVAIDYSTEPPVLAVKLQEMFGYEGQPAVLNNRVPLLLHLLSPAKRPIQVTSDLPHFWRHTYQDVRKDMRGRYPKHPWPEDPLTAMATAKVKAKM